MGNNYESLKEELKEISKILKEFPESLKPQVFELMISTFQGKLGSLDVRKKPEKTEVKKEVIKTPPKKKRGSTSKEFYTIVKNLDLKGTGTIPSFVDFCNDKDVSSAIKFNVISIYYLKKLLKIDSVDLNHIYTCYKEMKKPLPNNLKQSIYDTSGPKYGYIDASNLNNLKVPTSGERFVEHELTKKIKSK